MIHDLKALYDPYMSLVQFTNSTFTNLQKSFLRVGNHHWRHFRWLYSAATYGLLPPSQYFIYLFFKSLCYTLKMMLPP